jgi:hypothetical protein
MWSKPNLKIFFSFEDILVLVKQPSFKEKKTIVFQFFTMILNLDKGLKAI